MILSAKPVEGTPVEDAHNGALGRYDGTGRTGDLPFADAESMGWDAYFESLFQRIDRKMLDDDKARYQGSHLLPSNPLLALRFFQVLM